MKKFFSLLLLFVALGGFPIALAGCGGTSSTDNIETPSDDSTPDEDPNDSGQE